MESLLFARVDHRGQGSNGVLFTCLPWSQGQGCGRQNNRRGLGGNERTVKRAAQLGLPARRQHVDYACRAPKVRQTQGLCKCGWLGSDRGVIIYSFDSHILPERSYGVLDCRIVLLQCDMLKLLQ